MLWMGALQHVLIATTVGMFFPLLVLDAAGASRDTAQNLMSICMLALGLGTILLCLKARGLGSGFLMPASFSGVYFSVSILAAKQGGLPLVAGMTMFAGLVQLSLSRVLHRLRAYLPTEIAGLTMLMAGMTLAVVGFNQITGVSGPADSMKAEMDMPALLGVACIMAMVALHVWGSAGVRTYIVLIVLAVGSVVAFALEMVATSRSALLGCQPASPSGAGLGMADICDRHDAALCRGGDCLVAALDRRPDHSGENQRCALAAS